MADDKTRYTMAIDEELLSQIEDYRFGNRYASRAAATIALIRLGLEALKEKEAKEGK